MIETLTIPQQKILADQHPGELAVEPTSGGHMAYRRFIFRNSDNAPYFVKAHDPILLEDEARQTEMVHYLKKEATVYEHLRATGFQSIPEQTSFDEEMLVMSGLSEQDGWHWRAPKDEDDTLLRTYTVDVLGALDALEPSLDDYPPADVESSLTTFYTRGLGSMTSVNAQDITSRNIRRWIDHLDARMIRAAGLLMGTFDTFTLCESELDARVLNHHDARQANIAWHPDHGVSIVDWSWADPGLHHGDSTMFLMDLHKSGHDISDHMDHFNPTYAKLLIGYWLNRSKDDHMEGNEKVRFHQFVSAVSASELLLVHY